MKPRSFLFLLILTVATAAAAIAVLVNERLGGGASVAGTMLYPGLLDRVNDIDFVEVSTTADGTVSARREDGALGRRAAPRLPRRFQDPERDAFTTWPVSN